MVNFWLFVLASIGLTHLVVDGFIFQKPKEWLKEKGWEKLYYMTNCHQCIGFYLSMLVGLVFDPCPNCSFLLMRLLFYGCAGSFLAVLGAVLINYLNVIYPDKKT